ncbi:ion channel [Pseudonocardia nigra]|uniref:ion channel n=1 Tax=Pseudonocardia nigra TaxID=1921578 RepID=UPI001C601F34|nr:ion channel [Pseudonocardia nigra]
MGYLGPVIGLVVLALTAVDVVMTAFGPGRGRGPLLGPVDRTVSWITLRVRSRRVIVWAGPLLAALTTPIWLAAVWVGWALVFQLSGSVVTATTRQPTGGWEKAYFAGETLITLGSGEYVPGGPGWQALAVLAAASGFIVVTLGLSYLTSLLSAVLKRRSAASRIRSLGAGPVRICLAGWNGHDMQRLDAELGSLSSALTEVSQQQLAHPTLRHFHSADRNSAFGPALAGLDEALTIIGCALPAGCGPNPVAVAQVRSAIEALLQEEAPGEGREPPPPDLGPLRDAGLPVADDARFRAELRRLGRRRRELRLLVEHDGWTWADVDRDSS